MATSTIVKTKCDGFIKIKAGNYVSATPGPEDNYLDVAYEAGDLTIDIPGPAVNVFLDRGKFGSTPSLRYGDEQPVTFSFSAYLRHATDATNATLLDILTKQGAASGWESTLGATAEVLTVEVVFTITGPSGDVHTITMDHCALTGSIAEGDPNTISISGTSYEKYPTLG